jgi:SAM-dependent methyltransferase
MATSWSDANALPYHLIQWERTKESTKEFVHFLSSELESPGHFLDLGCGGGAATYTLSQFSRDSSWTGIDLDKNLVSVANRLANEKGVPNLKFLEADLCNFGSANIFDGVVSLQTVSWLDDFRPAFSNVFKNLRPKWFAVTSIFFEGDISAYTKVKEHRTKRSVHYNTYSIPEVKRFAREMGYDLQKKQKSEIPLDLVKPTDLDVMGTYTVRPDNFEKQGRLQISGPLLMSWYMLFFRKIQA